MITARAAASFEPVGRSVATARVLRPRHPPGLGLRRHRRRRRRPHERTGDQRRRPRGHLRRRPVPAQRRRRTHRGGRPLPGARDPPPGLPRHHGQPRPRGRPRPPAVRGHRRPLGRRVHAHPQAGLVPTRPPRPPGGHPRRRPRRSPPTSSRSPTAASASPSSRSTARGAISAWNEDAEELFGYPADQVIGKPLTDLAAWPHTPGTSTGIVEALQLSRWEGSYGIRGANGRVTPVYASHLRVRDTDGEPSTVCLLVRDHERAVLQTPLRVPASDTTAPPTARAPTPSRSSSAPPPRTTSTASSSARWNAPATCSTATPPSCSWPPTTRRSWRSAPPPACPPPASASPASPSRRAPAATARPGCRPSTRTSSPSPAPSPSSAAPACARSSRSR